MCANTEFSCKTLVSVHVFYGEYFIQFYIWNIYFISLLKWTWYFAIMIIQQNSLQFRLARLIYIIYIYMIIYIYIYIYSFIVIRRIFPVPVAHQYLNILYENPRCILCFYQCTTKCVPSGVESTSNRCFYIDCLFIILANLYRTYLAINSIIYNLTSNYKFISNSTIKWGCKLFVLSNACVVLMAKCALSWMLLYFSRIININNFIKLRSHFVWNCGRTKTLGLELRFLTQPYLHS